MERLTLENFDNEKYSRASREERKSMGRLVFHTGDLHFPLCWPKRLSRNDASLSLSHREVMKGNEATEAFKQYLSVITNDCNTSHALRGNFDGLTRAPVPGTLDISDQTYCKVAFHRPQLSNMILNAFIVIFNDLCHRMVRSARSVDDIKTRSERENWLIVQSTDNRRWV